MGVLYNFTRLINKYSCDFTLITSSEPTLNDMGYYTKGEKTEKTMRGAIVSHKESKIYRSEGTLTANDKKLFIAEPIDIQNSKVIYKGNLYSLEDSTQNAQFTGFYAYTLKHISAFKEGGE